MKRSIGLAAIAALALIFAAGCEPAPTGSTVGPLGFESPTFTTGTIDGQNGWQSDGAAGSGCATYDHQVDDEAASGTSPDDFGFGTQSLRISSAVTSGCFGDQTFSAPTGDNSGETGAPNDSVNGDRHGYFETSWSFADAGNPLATQTGLHVVASPDRGDGARMSWVEMADCSATPATEGDECRSGNEGLEVNFSEVNNANEGIPNPDDQVDDFVFHNVANGLDRNVAHTIRMQMWFFDGTDNDVVKVCADGTHCVTGGSWENYYRNDELHPTRPVDSVLFRTAGDANPGTAGNGIFIDDFVAKSVSYDGATVDVTGPSTVAEGTTGSDTTVPYTISLSEPLPFAVTVPYHTVNGTASDSSDYDATSGTVTFAPGDTASKTVNVTVHGDKADESHETYSLAIDAPTVSSRNPGDPSGTFVYRHANSKKTTIADDDSTVSISDASATEPASGRTPMSFTVSLANPSSVPVTVQYSTVDGTATHGADFLKKSNVTVTFNPGQVSKTVNVQIAADGAVEGDEFFSVHLHDADANTALGDPVGNGTIHDAVSTG
jgi:hypothetical protein